MTIPSWAKVGAKVVCVKEGANPNWVGSTRTKVGSVYRIRDVYQPCEDGRALLLFDEIQNEVKSFFGVSYEPGFRTSRFRPVQTNTQEQDIKLFTPLLNTKDEKELIDG